MPPVDEFAVALLADDEFVLPGVLEAVAPVEALRAEVFRPHADPQHAWPVAFQPGQRLLEQRAANAAVLLAFQQVQALQLAIAGPDGPACA